jgi:hypothetical protein
MHHGNAYHVSKLNLGQRKIEAIIISAPKAKTNPDRDRHSGKLFPIKVLPYRMLRDHADNAASSLASCAAASASLRPFIRQPLGMM